MLRNRRQKISLMLFTGMILLFLASSTRLLLHHGTHLSEANADGALGLVFGLAIGFMIVGLARTSRRSKCETEEGKGAQS
jgi:peptidoglycan/LPS O-acetylase OafA/YrhL